MTKTAEQVFTVAVAGNPNAGKTTIFNNLTGARQRVGNYPGVTVEWKEGSCRRGDLALKLVDLPGTYSLTAYSEEELVARDYLLNRTPDVVVDVVDASNLERNLFLTTELLEIGCPVIVVLNMADVARDRGFQIDIAGLSERLGVPVVPAVGNRGEGMDDIIEAVSRVMASTASLPGPAEQCRDAGPGPASFASAQAGERRARVDFGPVVEGLVERITPYLPPSPHQRWQALKLIESDPQVLGSLIEPGAREAVLGLVAEFQADLTDEPDIMMARRRYEHLGAVCAAVCRQPGERRVTRSDRIDRVVMHPVWGVPIFLATMYIVFTLTFTVGTPFMDLIDQGFGWLADTLLRVWPAGQAEHLQSLVVDGVIGGVGGVIVFLPNIVLLFLAIAVLEGTGYMARAAFVMDRFMSKVGLHGKSFIPLLIGFGCTVPAIMATRTLETRRDRIITMMVLPLMSCGARLPIYALMIPAFFAPKWQGPVLWIIYVTGILLAMGGAMLLRSTMFRGETTPFLMELPPYRMPTAASLLVQMWTRAWLYVKKAGTVILGAAVILWFLTYFPKPPADYVPPSDFDRAEVAAGTTFGQLTDADEIQAAELSYSIAGRVGRVLEPLIKPIGFDWRIGTALVGATAAKEVFVAQMGIVFAVGEADETSDHLRQRLRDRYSQLVGFCIMLFALISTPCIATFAITRQEAGSVKWALAQTIGLTTLAWIMTFLVYQGGLLLGWGVA
ncbi:ferrous iron transport protein B [bacterium]|nr:ferrous iron transport protein B [bacterium]